MGYGAAEEDGIENSSPNASYKSAGIVASQKYVQRHRELRTLQVELALRQTTRMHNEGRVKYCRAYLEVKEETAFGILVDELDRKCVKRPKKEVDLQERIKACEGLLRTDLQFAL